MRNKCEDIHNGECLNWDLIYCPAGWETGLCPGANNIKVILIRYQSVAYIDVDDKCERKYYYVINLNLWS